jgi:hypothetical protein
MDTTQGYLNLWSWNITQKNIYQVAKNVTNKSSSLHRELILNLFIQIAYYTHMGQAITIQKHANI